MIAINKKNLELKKLLIIFEMCSIIIIIKFLWPIYIAQHLHNQFQFVVSEELTV